MHISFYLLLGVTSAIADVIILIIFIIQTLINSTYDSIIFVPFFFFFIAMLFCFTNEHISILRSEIREENRYLI